MRNAARLTTIEIEKAYLKFSAGHFTIFGPDARERMHGHDFRIRCSVTAEIDENGLIFDYAILKSVLKSLCDELDEYVLLPTNSPYLAVESANGCITARFDGTEIVLPESEVKLLPLRNTSVEELSWWFLDRLLVDPRIGSFSLRNIIMGVSSGDGQWGIAEQAAAVQPSDSPPADVTPPPPSVKNGNHDSMTSA